MGELGVLPLLLGFRCCNRIEPRTEGEPGRGPLIDQEPGDNATGEPCEHRVTPPSPTRATANVSNIRCHWR